MVHGTHLAVAKAKSNKDEEKVWPKMKEPKDAETQTDPEITGVDADDFEEGDYSSSGEESGSDSDSSDEEAAGTDKSKENASSSVKTSKGVGAGQVRRKNIELKYYFGEDMPDAEMQRLAEADVLVPPGLEVKESNIPNAGRGVFAKCIIPKHEFFGPYIGRIVTRKEAKTYKESPYVWEVFDDYGKLTHLIDGRDALQSNWLRYVNCSKGLDEQNLRAVQYDKNIYYMATKEIAIGEELLTYYGDKFAKKIGIKPKKSSVVPGEESFVCKNCGKMYTNPGALIGHLKFKCNTGEQRSIFVPVPTGPRALIPKIKVSEEYARQQNEKLKKFKCPTCDKAFIRNYTLQCHMLIHKNVKEHKCETCGKEFTLLKHLQRHHLVHTGEKPYKCHLCGRAFSQQGSLQAHSRTHTGIKPYKCQICGRAFALQSPLMSHMKTHSNEKNFKCETCGKAFTHRNTLARHQLIHSGTRPYKCEECGKTFTQTNDLKRHSRIHTGIRPYKCHVCSKSFTVEFTLVCHLRTHTGERPYVCDHCGKTFTQPGQRLKHSRKDHPDLPLPTSGPITPRPAYTEVAPTPAPTPDIATSTTQEEDVQMDVPPTTAASTNQGGAKQMEGVSEQDAEHVPSTMVRDFSEIAAINGWSNDKMHVVQMPGNCQVVSTEQVMVNPEQGSI